MSEIRLQLEIVRNANGIFQTPYKWRVTHDGFELGVFAQPEHQAARELLRLKRADRGDVMVTYRGSQPCMSWHVGVAADTKIEDTSHGRLRVVKWQPFDKERFNAS